LALPASGKWQIALAPTQLPGVAYVAMGQHSLGPDTTTKEMAAATRVGPATSRWYVAQTIR
jgi:hypothetical protein